jgi:hypothetical protein
VTANRKGPDIAGISFNAGQEYECIQRILKVGIVVQISEDVSAIEWYTREQVRYLQDKYKLILKDSATLERCYKIPANCSGVMLFRPSDLNDWLHGKNTNSK